MNIYSVLYLEVFINKIILFNLVGGWLYIPFRALIGRWYGRLYNNLDLRHVSMKNQNSSVVLFFLHFVFNYENIRQYGYV